MFDLKKRHSFSLTPRTDADPRQTEEFRRVAVRRRASAGVVHDVHDHHHHHASVTGTPIPAHLQRPGKSEPEDTNGWETIQRPTPNRDKDGDISETNAVSLHHLSSASNGLGSPSPVEAKPAARCSPVYEAGTHSSSTVRRNQGTQHGLVIPAIVASLPGVLSCCSPVTGDGRGGPNKPATKLVSRSQSGLMTRLQAPSPFNRRTRSFSPATRSKPWIGQNRGPGTSQSIVRRGRSPLKPVPSANCSMSTAGTPVPSNCKLAPTTNRTGRHLDSSGTTGRSLEHANGVTTLGSEGGQDGVAPGVGGRTRTTSSDSLLLCWNGRSVEDGSDEEGSRDGRTEERSRDDRTEERSKDEGSIDEGSRDGQTEEGSRDEGSIDEGSRDEGSIDEGSRDGQTEGLQRKLEESREQKLWRTANELLQTEKAYVDRLHLLDQVFCVRLTEEAARGSFPPEVVRGIFSNISSIHSFHSQFLMPDLQHRLDHWWEHPGLGDVMLQHAPFLRMYAEYVKNFDQAMELLRTWTERSAAFRNLIQDIQNQGVCGSLTLQHHMLEPVQRVPRYEMLLREYLRKLPENDPDYNLAHKSLQTISMAAIQSNNAIHQAERLKRLLEIYEMIGEENVVNPSNEFLREGRLLKLAARNASAMERYIFLFNNFLLCCIPKFSLVGQRFAVRTQIRVEGMQVQQTTNEDHPHTFQVSGKERTLELQASSEQERDDWIKVIQEAIDEYQKKHGIFKLASKEIDAEVTTEELGRRAPRWIRDNEVTVCMKCQEAFNALTRRRHHCRACGCVVCWRCSDNKVALEYDGNKLNKVCKDCYSVLIDRSRPERRGEGKTRRSMEWDPVCLPQVSSDVVMSSFLQHGDGPGAWQRMWSVIPRTEPPLLCLYASPHDAIPLSRVPLLGYSVEDCPRAPPELHGQVCFRLVHKSRNRHVFCCDTPELKQRWLAVLHAAVRSERLTGNGNATNGDMFVASAHDAVNGNIMDNETGLDDRTKGDDS